MDFQRELVGLADQDLTENVCATWQDELASAPSTTELLEGTSDCAIIVDANWRITYLNERAATEIVRRSPLVGLSLWDTFPAVAGTVFETQCRQAMQNRIESTFEAQIEPQSVRYCIRTRPLSTGGMGLWFRRTSEVRDREAELSNIFAQSLVGIMQYGPNGQLRTVNAKFCEILGRTPEQLQGLTLSDYTHPDDLSWNLPLLQAHRETGEPFYIEKRYLRPDGSAVWCKVNVSFVQGNLGEIESTIIVAEDITENKLAELALRDGEQLYRSVLESSADCIIILDLDGTLRLMNGPGLQLLDLGDFEKVRGALWSSLWPKESRKLVASALDEARNGRPARFHAFCPTANGTDKWWDVVVSPMCDDIGNVTRILSISRDVTIQRASADRLKWASEHDPLTELPNRRAFEAHLQASIIRAMQKDQKVGLLLVDLDHFKHVNDTLGHPAGDHLLSVFGTRLRESVRENDFVARLGGDEFAIVFESSDRDLDLLGAGASILERLAEPIRYDGRVLEVGASIGGAEFPSDANSANELFKNADIALYALKESGRGGTRMFHQHLRQQAQIVASQLSLARSAITQQSVEPHYQQKINLQTGEIVGFEALLRWRHAAQGIQPPDTVAEAFRDYELATRIGELMQQRVFGDIRGWLDKDIPVGFVALNAAPVEFLRDDFAERILGRMKKYNIPPHMIELEVTEHVFFERGSEFVGRALRLLSHAGVRIALDDFGTGYSSLSHLRDYPVDVVKIDRSFIERVTIDHEVRAIVTAVIDLARSLSLDIVAEGVERDEQRQLLIELGCHTAQGFFFGKAIEASGVPVLIMSSPNSAVSCCNIPSVPQIRRAG